MRGLIIFLLLLSLNVCGQTYVASNSNPADGGSLASGSINTTMPGSAAAGDLIVAIVTTRNATGTFGIGNPANQTWNTLTPHQSSTATLSMGVFWCQYNGSVNGQTLNFTSSSSTSSSVVLHAFRPTSSSNVWGVDANTPSNGLHSFNASTGAINADPVGSWTPANNNSVSLAIWATDDDNTWGSLTGTGWVTTGSAQYRNTAGSDQSSSYAHRILTTAASVANPSKTQATLGGDPGIKGAFVFYEYTSTALPRKVRMIID